MATSGKLLLTMVEARLERDTEMIGKMDPYVVISQRMEKFRTKTQDGAGKNPVWDEIVTLDVKYIGDDLTIWVKDEEICEDELIGETTCKLSSLCVEGGIDDWWQLTYKGKKAGMLHMKGEWQPAGGNPMATAAARKPGVIAGQPQIVNTAPTYL